MAVFPWQSTVQDQDGNAIASAQLTIRDGGPSGAVSTIFSDSAETPLANPFNATSDGFAQFWAASGTYYIEAESGGQTTDGWYVVLSGAAAGIPIELTATVAAGEAVSMDGALVSEATAAEYLGLAQAAGVATDTLNVQSTGNFTLGTWAWTPDEYVYITNAGALTQTPPTGTHRRIGIATTATVIALSAGPVVVETGGAGSENAIPALDDAGLLDYTMIEKAATGGAGAENLLVQADAGGEIDISFLGAVVDTSRQFTASGALTAGNAVALSAVTGGVVEAVGQAASTIEISSEYDPATDFGLTQQNDQSIAYSETSGTFCLVCTSANSAGPGTLSLIAMIGTYSAETDTWTFGTATTLYDTGGTTFVRGVSLAWDALSDDWICVFSRDTTTVSAVAIQDTGSLTAAIVGSVVTMRTGTDASSDVCVAMHPSDGTGFAACSDTGIRAYPFSYNGSAITFGTDFDIDASEGKAPCAQYATTEGKYLVVYSEDATNRVVGRMVTSNGTSITAASTVVQLVNLDSTRNSVTIDQTSEKFMVTTSPGSVGRAILGQIASGAVSVLDNAFAVAGTAGELTRIQQCWYDDVNDVWWLAGSTADAGDPVAFTPLTIPADVVTAGTTVVGASDGGSSSNADGANQLAMLGASERLIFFANGTTIDDEVPLIALSPGTATTNAANFIGFAQASVADTETVEVALLGDVNANQTGLTFNNDYYITNAGALQTGVTGFGKVGRALSATEILVTKNTWSA